MRASLLETLSSNAAFGGVTAWKTHCGRLGRDLKSRKNSTTVNIKHATAAFAVAVALAGAPAFAASPDAQSEPIHIDNVQIYGRSMSPEQDFVAPDSARITFTNQNDAPATDVIFALESNGYVVDRFHDVGSFAKGVKIHHLFPEHEMGADQRVAVEKATFADGTVWANDDVPPAPEPSTLIGVRVNKTF
jgi:hypothetical protein